jgi:dTDP-4-dehydrorhamnose reductase
MAIYDSILITGGGGMLAHALVDVLATRGHSALSLSRAELDIANPEALQKIFAQYRPTLLLNCAAHTKVDLCEQEKEKADAINGYAVGEMARLSKAAGTFLVHVSTDFVFDGSLGRPYQPTDPVHPLNVYGQSKLLGETELQKHAPKDWMIVRTSWVYGRHGVNFPRTMVQAAQAGKSLKVVGDQHGSPTYTLDLAEAMLDLLNTNARGIWHVTNSGQTTWLDFARATLHEFGIDVPVAGCTSAEWAKIRPGGANRPTYSVLDVEPVARQLGRPMRNWRDALQSFRAAVQAGGF